MGPAPSCPNVGDVGFKDPVTGNGIKDAFVRGQLLSDAVLQGFKNPYSMQQCLAQYQSLRDDLGPRCSPGRRSSRALSGPKKSCRRSTRQSVTHGSALPSCFVYPSRGRPRQPPFETLLRPLGVGKSPHNAVIVWCLNRGGGGSPWSPKSTVVK
jgi:hypothetical protein